RFLNIANPWTDKRLLDWKGYVETRYFDSENHLVDSETPGAEAVEMIPLGRTVYDFVTGRRGMDINQPSRLQTYSQLKLLLALNNSMEPELREEVSGR